jgi:hypothetical protein
MRVLSDYEVDLVTGGWGSSDITVWGDPWDWADFNSFFYLLSADWGSSVGGGGSSTPPPEQPAVFQEPNCNVSNKITKVQPPDGAKYFAPENVGLDYLTNALNHLSNYSRSHSAAALLQEFNAMYSNPNHPHFIDFKDWGTAGGPPGSVGGGTTSWYSSAAGQNVSGSVFEPFGNFFYGYAGTWAGISPDVLYGAAALVQEGDTGWIPRDRPEDSPHVSAGIAAAKAYQADPMNNFGINDGSCATGMTYHELGEMQLAPQVSWDHAYQDPTFRAGLWGYLEGRYMDTVPQ